MEGDYYSYFLAHGEGEILMLEYEATFDCERFSDTWNSCIQEDDYCKENDIEYCTSCKARKKLFNNALDIVVNKLRQCG